MMIKSNVKKNMPVKFTRRNGKPATGTVFSLPVTKTNGTWVLVNTGTKDRPVLGEVRIEKLSPDTSPAAAVAGATSKPVAAPAAKPAEKVKAPAKTSPAEKVKVPAKTSPANKALATKVIPAKKAPVVKPAAHTGKAVVKKAPAKK